MGSVADYLGWREISLFTAIKFYKWVPNGVNIKYQPLAQYFLTLGSIPHRDHCLYTSSQVWLLLTIGVDTSSISVEDHDDTFSLSCLTITPTLYTRYMDNVTVSHLQTFLLHDNANQQTLEELKSRSRLD
jgi:hypothetical protein